MKEEKETGEYPSDGRSAFGKLVVLMVTAFIDMLGMLMVLPLLPFYATEMGAGGTAVGVLVASFSVAQLLSAPIWGRFSDRYGRRPALMIGLGASAVAYVVFAFADSLWLLFLSRIVQGAGGGTVSVIQAYVADATRPQDRAKSLGWLSAATNAGVAIGPVIGSWASIVSTHTPGLVAACFCLLNMLFAWRYLTEVRAPGKTNDSNTVQRSSRQAVLHVVTRPNEASSRLILIYAISIGAFQGTTAVLALLLAWRFGVTAQTIGYFFMYIGILSVLTRAVILGKLVDRYGEAKLSRYGLVLMSAGLLGLALSRDYVTLALAVGLLPLGTAFTFPCVTSLLSRVISSAERGLYMGVQQTYGGVSRVIFPILFGVAFDRISAPSPFIISAVLVMSTLLLGRDMEKYTTR